MLETLKYKVKEFDITRVMKMVLSVLLCEAASFLSQSTSDVGLSHCQMVIIKNRLKINNRKVISTTIIFFNYEEKTCGPSHKKCVDLQADYLETRGV